MGWKHGRLDMAWFWHLVYIIYSLEVGFFLIVLPWLSIWDDNYFLYRYPHIRPIVANLLLKCAVLGLGALNVAIGVQEFFQIKKGPRGFCAK